jgi:hypothetical protein
VTAKTLTMIAGVLGAAVVSACTAHSEPSKFPDINGYTPVNIADYRIDTTTPGMPSSQVFFLTPDGIPCTFSSGTGGCKGENLPGVPAEDKNPYTYIDTASGIQPARSTSYVNNTIRGQQIRTLPPFHSITVSGVTCGVDDKGMTACKDPQGRGFVLSPQWSGWLPQV